MIVVPMPSLLVNRFTNGSQNFERIHLFIFNKFLTKSYKRTNGCGSCIELIYLVFIYNVPIPSSIRISRDPLKHQAGCTIEQRPINYVRVACDPAYISRTEVYISTRILKNIFKCICRIHHVPTNSVNDTFWFIR